MSNQPTTVLLAIDFLNNNPEWRTISPKRLARLVNDPKCSYATWKKARKALNLPPIERIGMSYAKTPKQQRKAAFALYPNTHKIVVDTERLKIVFHGDNGFKVSEKRTKKALAASLRLFKLAQFETKEHNTETGIMILTLKPEALEARAA